MKLKIKFYVSDFMNVDGKYQTIEIRKEGECRDWDDLQNFIGYYTEIFGEAKFEIEPIKEDE